jgi:hypothetical protein
LSSSIHSPKYEVPAESPTGYLDAEELYQKISDRIAQTECNLATTAEDCLRQKSSLPCESKLVFFFLEQHVERG